MIGRIVADAAEEHLDPSLAKKFTVDRDCIRVSSLRTSAVGELDTDGLCSPEDLLPDDNNT